MNEKLVKKTRDHVISRSDIWKPVAHSKTHSPCRILYWHRSTV